MWSSLRIWLKPTHFLALECAFSAALDATRIGERIETFMVRRDVCVCVCVCVYLCERVYCGAILRRISHSTVPKIQKKCVGKDSLIVRLRVCEGDGGW